MSRNVLISGSSRGIGGLIGAGSARIPMECFEKAMEAYAEEYQL